MTTTTSIVPAALTAPPPLGRAALASPCVVCGGGEVTLFLDLGRTALANNLVRRPAVPDEPHFPLRAGYCPACWHVQLLDRVPPAAMFSEYLYVSSASSTLRAHLDGLSRAIAARVPVAPEELVVDIGSNDGTLLAAFGRHVPSARLQGVDPAANLAALARAVGVPTENDYFHLDSARRLAALHGRRARVITATNSFPHIPALDAYLAGVAELLAPGGVFVVEAHYLADMIGQLAFDTIYHEHVSYWALGPMRVALERHGLEVFDVERLPIHHGQLRAWIGHRNERPVDRSVAALAAEEERAGLRCAATYTHFARQVEQLGANLRATVAGLGAQGLRVAGYGAPAKASTLAAYCRLGPREVEWIADRNPLKQGLYTPGTGIPIVDCGRIAAEPPGVLILFAWNFADEIMQELDAYRRGGGRFLIPVPTPKLV